MRIDSSLRVSQEARTLAKYIEGQSGYLVRMRRPVPSEAGFLDVWNRSFAKVDPNSRAAHVVVSGELDHRIEAHELRHLERYLVDRVWQFAPAEALPVPQRRQVAALDNDLEHLTIVPFELVLPGAGEFWEALYSEVLKGVPNSDHVTSDLSRHLLFLRAVLPNSAVRRDAEQMAGAIGITANVDRLEAWHKQAPDDKVGLGRLMIEQAGLPEAWFKLQRFRPTPDLVEVRAL
ncbi:hypothetical protein AB4Z10_18720 [Bosea sp. RAF48]|uniref:hypothetical protein n=1 Tax=Bosea sp. RAF48 TaxID=3237480 RepID=UPI003F93CCE2